VCDIPRNPSYSFVLFNLTAFSFLRAFCRDTIVIFVGAHPIRWQRKHTYVLLSFSFSRGHRTRGISILRGIYCADDIRRIVSHKISVENISIFSKTELKFRWSTPSILFHLSLVAFICTFLIVKFSSLTHLTRNTRKARYTGYMYTSMHSMRNFNNMYSELWTWYIVLKENLFTWVCLRKILLMSQHVFSSRNSLSLLSQVLFRLLDNS